MGADHHLRSSRLSRPIDGIRRVIESSRPHLLPQSGVVECARTDANGVAGVRTGMIRSFQWEGTWDHL